MPESKISSRDPGAAAAFASSALAASTSRAGLDDRQEAHLNAELTAASAGLAGRRAGPGARPDPPTGRAAYGPLVGDGGLTPRARELKRDLAAHLDVATLVGVRAPEERAEELLEGVTEHVPEVAGIEPDTPHAPHA